MLGPWIRRFVLVGLDTCVVMMACTLTVWGSSSFWEPVSWSTVKVVQTSYATVVDILSAVVPMVPEIPGGAISGSLSVAVAMLLFVGERYRTTRRQTDRDNGEDVDRQP